MQDMNSWEADLKRVKAEYLGLNSNIQGPEIHSLRPQVSIANASNIEKNTGAILDKYHANNLSGVRLYVTAPVVTASTRRASANHT